ncbi:hypothetical protein TI39_contig491g00006 [Zymoseptoria brevis]|uniref:Uncharacterized protein n=1 Tax=Zymoseptoria brevis TaxID=1047168 RepID=A0A0F4GMN3_9PEZI|nr:hypothetical protein TI39_contig491g00006 [Zymoseptoria brevis]
MEYTKFGYEQATGHKSAYDAHRDGLDLSALSLGSKPPGTRAPTSNNYEIPQRNPQVLGCHGVELATALWNMTTLFQRSLTESLDRSQDAVDHAHHTKIETDRSDICRDIHTEKFSTLVFTRTSGEKMQLLVLNEKLGLLNSTLFLLTPSHSSLIRDRPFAGPVPSPGNSSVTGQPSNGSLFLD